LVSEFVFADPADTGLFDTASPNILTDDLSNLYPTLEVVSQTRYVYDSLGRVEQVKVAVSDTVFTFDSPDSWYTTEYGYDNEGRRIEVTEDVTGLALITTTQYDRQGQLEKTTYPDGHWQKQVYNGRGLVIMTIDGYGPEETTPNDFIVVEYEYDANRNQKKMIKGDTEYEWTYDALDRVKREPIIQWTEPPMASLTSEQAKPKRTYWKGGDFEPLAQYTDGFGLQVYAGGDPVNKRDDWGLNTDCDIHTYKNNEWLGHQGLIVSGQDYDWGPATAMPFWPGASECPWGGGGPGKSGTGKQVSFTTKN